MFLNTLVTMRFGCGTYYLQSRVNETVKKKKLSRSNERMLFFRNSWVENNVMVVKIAVEGVFKGSDF